MKRVFVSHRNDLNEEKMLVSPFPSLPLNDSKYAVENGMMVHINANGEKSFNCGNILWLVMNIFPFRCFDRTIFLPFNRHLFNALADDKHKHSICCCLAFWFLRYDETWYNHKPCDLMWCTSTRNAQFKYIKYCILSICLGGWLVFCSFHHRHRYLFWCA